MADTTPRTPLEELRRAVYDKGREPQHHDEIMRRHRKEWPALWRAIDALLAAPSGEPQRAAVQRFDPLLVAYQRAIESGERYTIATAYGAILDAAASLYAGAAPAERGERERHEDTMQYLNAIINGSCDNPQCGCCDADARLARAASRALAAAPRERCPNCGEPGWDGSPCGKCGCAHAPDAPREQEPLRCIDVLDSLPRKARLAISEQILFYEMQRQADEIARLTAERDALRKALEDALDHTTYQTPDSVIDWRQRARRALATTDPEGGDHD